MACLLSSSDPEEGNRPRCLDARIQGKLQVGCACRRAVPWFPHRGRRSSRLCRFSSTGSTRSPEAEEVLRRQAVRWRADVRCTQSIRRTLRVARPRSSLQIFMARGIPNRCISLFFSSWWEPAAQACALDRSSYSRRAQKKSTAEANFFWKNWIQKLASAKLLRRVPFSPGPFPTFLFERTETTCCRLA